MRGVPFGLLPELCVAKKKEKGAMDSEGKDATKKEEGNEVQEPNFEEGEGEKEKVEKNKIYLEAVPCEGLSKEKAGEDVEGKGAMKEEEGNEVDEPNFVEKEKEKEKVVKKKIALEDRRRSLFPRRWWASARWRRCLTAGFPERG